MEHGLSLAETRVVRQKMLDEQGGICSICRYRIKGKGALDHCHATGKVRSVLCNSCNTGLGQFRDSPEALVSAIEYLIRHFHGDNKFVRCEWGDESDPSQTSSIVVPKFDLPKTKPPRKKRKRFRRSGYIISGDEFSRANEFGIQSD